MKIILDLEECLYLCSHTSYTRLTSKQRTKIDTQINANKVKQKSYNIEFDLPEEVINSVYTMPIFKDNKILYFQLMLFYKVTNQYQKWLVQSGELIKRSKKCPVIR